MRRPLVFLALALLACSHKTPEQKLLDDVDPAISWVATLQLTAEKWLVNSVPSTFVRDAVDAAEKTLDQADKTIDHSPANASLRHELHRQLAIAHSSAQQMREAVERSDRKRIAELREQFATANAALQRLGRHKESR